MSKVLKATLFGIAAMTATEAFADEDQENLERTSVEAAQAEPSTDFLGGNFTGWVEFGNERMFRGNSETQNSDIINLQGLLTWTHQETGMYMGYWMATNKFDLVPEIGAESGPYFGKFGTIGDTGVNYNVFVWHYIYHTGGGGGVGGDNKPWSRKSKLDEAGYDGRWGNFPKNAYQANYTELWFTANMDVTDDLNLYVEYVPTLDAWFGAKDEKGHGVRGYSSAFTPTYQLGSGWAVDGTLGYQWFDKPGYTPVGSWFYYNVGLSKSLPRGYKVKASYHDTNVNNDGPTNIWKEHYVLAISKSF